MVWSISMSNLGSRNDCFIDLTLEDLDPDDLNDLEQYLDPNNLDETPTISEVNLEAAGSQSDRLIIQDSHGLEQIKQGLARKSTASATNSNVTRSKTESHETNPQKTVKSKHRDGGNTPSYLEFCSSCRVKQTKEYWLRKRVCATCYHIHRYDSSRHLMKFCAGQNGLCHRNTTGLVSCRFCKFWMSAYILQRVIRIDDAQLIDFGVAEITSIDGRITAQADGTILQKTANHSVSQIERDPDSRTPTSRNIIQQEESIKTCESCGLETYRLLFGWCCTNCHLKYRKNRKYHWVQTCSRRDGLCYEKRNGQQLKCKFCLFWRYAYLLQKPIVSCRPNEGSNIGKKSVSKKIIASNTIEDLTQEIIRGNSFRVETHIEAILSNSSHTEARRIITRSDKSSACFVCGVKTSNLFLRFSCSECLNIYRKISKYHSLNVCLSNGFCLEKKTDKPIQCKFCRFWRFTYLLHEVHYQSISDQRMDDIINESISHKASTNEPPASNDNPTTEVDSCERGFRECPACCMPRIPKTSNATTCQPCYQLSWVSKVNNLCYPCKSKSGNCDLRSSDGTHLCRHCRLWSVIKHSTNSSQSENLKSILDIDDDGDGRSSRPPSSDAPASQQLPSDIHYNFSSWLYGDLSAFNPGTWKRKLSEEDRSPIHKIRRQRKKKRLLHQQSLERQLLQEKESSSRMNPVESDIDAHLSEVKYLTQDINDWEIEPVETTFTPIIRVKCSNIDANRDERSSQPKRRPKISIVLSSERTVIDRRPMLKRLKAIASRKEGSPEITSTSLIGPGEDCDSDEEDMIEIDCDQTLTQ